MVLKYPAFYRTKLEQDKRDQFTVEVNPEQRAWIDELKIDFDIKSDAVAMKFALEIAIKQKKSMLSAKSWQYLLRGDRQRLSEFQKLPEPPSEENATQKLE